MDFGQKSGRCGARALHGDVQFLLLAAGLDLDTRLAIGHGRDHARLAHRRHFGIRRVELGLPGDIVERTVRQPARDHDALRRPLSGQDEIPGGRLNSGDLDLRLLGECESRQAEQQGKGAKPAHDYA
jgi:hypothetical protein